MNRTGTGATRVKSFHCKYSEQGLEYIDDQINRWLDEHPDIEVKFVTPTVMTFEGKFREPALVLNVWY
jgi:ABC-type glycerol-3-phosphate transport system substrate-binding protein